MNESLLRFLIVWGPTLLFVLSVLGGFVWGLVRGFRKSLILFIHMIVAFTICLIVFLCMVKSKNIDSSMVSFVNKMIGKSGKSLQEILKVDSSLSTMRDILFTKIVSGMSEESLTYYLVVDNAAYIYTLVDVAYHLILFIVIILLYLMLIFLFYIIYLIAYPVRRKVKKWNKKFEAGEVNHPYKKKRLLGGLIGCVRSLIIGVIGFSFIGGLLFVLTANEKIPSREELREEEVSFEDENFNKIYDYYSYVCELSNTGIFKVLNGIKDTKKTPFYFYISDLVFQGQLKDENLDVNEKLYLRDELGEYVGFVKDVFLLMVKYTSNEELNHLIGDSSSDEKMDILISVFQRDGFSEEFDQIIDNFETKPFVKNLCISTLTSLINHIDLATNGNEKLVGLVNTIFKGENALKVTDLGTEEDVKNIFKAVVNVVASSNEENIAIQELNDELIEFPEPQETKKLFETKQLILYANKLIPTIQNLSIFKEEARKDKCNKLLSKVYVYCSETFVSEEITLPEISSDVVWLDEFNILLAAAEPLLNISYKIYDNDMDVLINNLFEIFEGADKEENEKDYDSMVEELSKSKLLNVVFRSSMVGNAVDGFIVKMTYNEEASIPKNIEFVGSEGECATLLKSLKCLIQNDGKSVYNTFKSSDDVSGDAIASVFELLGKPVSSGSDVTLLDELLNSQIFHYVLSSLFYYGKFGNLEFYTPAESLEQVVEGSGENEKTYQIIKKSEISYICHMMVDCKDVIILLIDEVDNINYAKIFTNDNFVNGIKESLILKGTVANILINSAEATDTLVIPKELDTPENWIDAEEVENIIIAISALAHLETSTGDPLINQIMSSSIKTEEFLDIEADVVDKLFDSIVLRYTVSNLFGSIGDSTFKIVVPARDLEINDALTIKDTYVDVIKKDVLTSILKDIRKVITIDSASNNVNLNIQSLFKEKEFLVKDDILHASIIYYLLNMQQNDPASSIVIPVAYQNAFNEFKDNSDFTTNIWFGTSANSFEDDEIYLMLEFVEGCIADDEGNIPDDFSFESDFSSQISLHNREKDLNDICNSALINATITNKMMDTLAVPASLYQNELLDKTEMKKLLECCFLIMEKDEVTITELSDFDTNNIVIKESMVEPLTESEILCTTLSKYLADSEDVMIPCESAYLEKMVQENEQYIIYHSEDQKELQSILFTLIDVFGTDQLNTGEKSVIIKDINTENLILNLETKEKVKESKILQATLSHYVTDSKDTGLIIPADESIIEPMEIIGFDGLKNVIEANELDSLLDACFHLFGDGDTLKVNEIKTEHVMIDKEKIKHITISKIMNTTIMDSMLNDEDLIVPAVENRIVQINQLMNPDLTCVIVEKDEIDYLLNSLIDMIGTDGVIDASAIQISHIHITSGVDLNRSEILSATLGNKILGVGEFEIPTECVLPSVSVLSKNADNGTKDLIRVEDLSQLLDSIFCLVDELNINSGQSDLNMDDIIFTKDNIPMILSSVILEATISEKMFVDGIYIPNQLDVVSLKEFYGKDNHECIILEEMLNLWDAIFVVGNTDSISIKEIQEPNRFKQIHKSQESKEAILNSKILNSTVSKIVYDTETLEKLPSNIEEVSLLYGYYNQDDFNIINSTELNHFIDALFATTNEEIINFDELTIDRINLPHSKDEALQLTNSGIFTATMSKEVLSIGENNIVVLDNSKAQDNGYTYIVAADLADLVVGLSVGLGMNNLDEVSSFDTIAVPETENSTKVNAITDSIILRATISKKAMANDTVQIFMNSNSYTVYQYQNRNVLVFEKAELSHLIDGINMMGGDFDNLSISLEKILQASNKGEILNVIGHSDIYRGMMSKELMKEVFTLNAYQVIDSSTQTHNIELDGVVISYEYQSYLGRYIIQDPEEVDYYTDFEMMNVENHYLFTQQDILALEYVSISNL